MSKQKPAARMGDMHICPVTKPALHIGGVITSSNDGEVWIGSQLAARLGDECFCTNAIDKIITGSSTVFIKGKPAARQDDSCLHGGTIITGCMTVLIGGMTCIQSETGEERYVRLVIPIPQKKYRCPSRARRDNIVARAIENAMAVLKAKLELLQQNDPATIEQFRIWFGKTDEWSKYTIIVRIEKEIRIMQDINTGNFRKISDRKAKEYQFARIINFDDTRTIYLGNPFWKTKLCGKNSRMGTLIHEVSHYHDIGPTEDHVCGEHDCMRMAIKDPEKALMNADSYQYFMES